MSFQITLAEKAQLDTQNEILTQINAKIAPITLGDVTTAPIDFTHDPIVIRSGGLDSLNRRITT